MSTEESVLFGIIAFLAGFIVIFFIVGIIFYLLYAIGMYKITKRDGREDLAWLAWIPIAQIFLIPLLVEDDVHESMRGKFTLVFGIVFVATFIISFFFSFIYVLYYIVLLYGFYFVAMRYSQNAIVHVVIAAITFGSTIPISIFMFRNRTANVIA